MPDVKLILTADNSQYISKMREAQQANQRLSDSAARNVKREKGLIEDMEDTLAKYEQAKKKAYSVEEIERYNRKIQEAKLHLDEYNRAGVQAQKETESLTQSISKWALGIGAVTLAFNALKTALKDTIGGMYLFNTAGAAMKQVLYNIVTGVSDWNKGVAESIILAKKMNDLRLEEKITMLEAKRLMAEYNRLYTESIAENNKGVESITKLTAAKKKFQEAIKLEMDETRKQLDQAKVALELRPLSESAQNEVIRLAGDLEDLVRQQETTLRDITRRIAAEEEKIFSDALTTIKKFMNDIDKEINDRLEEDRKAAAELERIEQSIIDKSQDSAIKSLKEIRKERDKEHAQQIKDAEDTVTIWDIIKARTTLAQEDIGDIIEEAEKRSTRAKEEENAKKLQADQLFRDEIYRATTASLDLIYVLQQNAMAREIALVDENTRIKLEIQRALHPNIEEEVRIVEEGEKLKLEIQKKYAKRMQVIQIAQAVADTAAAILKTYAELGFPLGIPAAIAMAAVGALQIATIKAQKYAKGGWTGEGTQRDETGERVAGVVHEKEFVVKRGPAAKYRDVLEAINKEDHAAIFNTFNKIEPELLGGRQVTNVSVENSGPNNRLDRINNQLSQLNRNLSPKKQVREEVSIQGNIKIIQKGSNTRTVKR